ncbi:MAG: urease accessory protein UreD [Pseudomonadota bacterium]
MTSPIVKASPTADSSPPSLQRAVGAASLRTAKNQGRTRIADLYQKANAKIRVPRQHHEHLEAVLINTAGGITGGDRLDWTIQGDEATKTLISTQACERIYRRGSGPEPAFINSRLTVADNAHLLWLPQETILFDGAALKRTLIADLAAHARLTALETIVLGREAMEETIATLSLEDRWEITSNGALVHADNVRIGPSNINQLTTLARLKDHTVFGTLVDIAPNRAPFETDQRLAMTARLQGLAASDPLLQIGASIFPHKTIIRFTARTSYHLRARLPDLLKELVPEYALPAVWRL